MSKLNGASEHSDPTTSCAFILSYVTIRGKLPVEVAPQHFIRRAAPEEIARIKSFLPAFMPFPTANGFLYECEVKKTPGNKPRNFHYAIKSLPPQDWRYWVISFKGSNTEIQDIASAASLLKNDLEIGFSLFNGFDGGGQGTMWHSPSIFSFFDAQGLCPQPAVEVSVEELKEIRTNFELIQDICPDYPHLKRAFRRLRDLRSLPRSSEATVVGLFSIIESLIAHRPQSGEIGDSIGHQIKTKVPLLRKRFSRPLEYSSYFGQISEKKIWSSLYQYRSNVVHGGHGDEKQLSKVLGGRANVISFLNEIVKLLFLVALNEPVLLDDLKAC